MITEEMLRSAAAEVADSMTNSIPDDHHSFTPKFERKIQTIVRKADHPIRYRVTRQIAAILTLIVTCCGILFVASPTVHSMVISWVSQQAGNRIQITPLDTTPRDVLYEYYLPEEFDGYKLKEAIDTGDEMFYIYFNEDGDMLSFDYTYGWNDPYIYLSDIEDHQHICTFIGSQPAELYISPNDDESSVIYWHNVEENVLFFIMAPEDAQTLIAYAKKVEKFLKK